MYSYIDAARCRLHEVCMVPNICLQHLRLMKPGTSARLLGIGFSYLPFAIRIRMHEAFIAGVNGTCRCHNFTKIGPVN